MAVCSVSECDMLRTERIGWVSQTTTAHTIVPRRLLIWIVLLCLCWLKQKMVWIFTESLYITEALCSRRLAELCSPCEVSLIRLWQAVIAQLLIWWLSFNLWSNRHMEIKVNIKQNWEPGCQQIGEAWLVSRGDKGEKEKTIGEGCAKKRRLGWPTAGGGNISLKVTHAQLSHQSEYKTSSTLPTYSLLFKSFLKCPICWALCRWRKGLNIKDETWKLCENNRNPHYIICVKRIS